MALALYNVPALAAQGWAAVKQTLRSRTQLWDVKEVQRGVRTGQMAP